MQAFDSTKWMINAIHASLVTVLLPSTAKLHTKLKLSLNTFSVYPFLGKRLYNHNKVCKVQYSDAHCSTPDQSFIVELTGYSVEVILSVYPSIQIILCMFNVTCVRGP